MTQNIIIAAAALSAIVGSTTTVSAQWVPNYQIYTIQRAGLIGPEHTGSQGLQVSYVNLFDAPGWVVGSSARFTGVNSDNGLNTWVYNRATNTTVQTGLTSAAHTGIGGYQVSTNLAQNTAGLVVGISQRSPSESTNNGRNVWIYNPATNATVQTGLTDAEHTGSAGYQFSSMNSLHAAGHLTGYSLRFLGVNTDNGLSTWLYNAVTNTTVQTGLTGPDYTGSAGYRYSTNSFLNAAGQVAGLSHRFTGINTYNGQNAWVYNLATNTTTQAGLVAAANTGSGGYQVTFVNFQNDAGLLAGGSLRIIGVNTYNGSNTWFFNPATNTTAQTGLTGAVHSGSSGFQVSFNYFQNSAGQIAGASQRVIGVNSNNGFNTWVFNPTTNITTQIGLNSAAHTGSAGYQDSFINFQNDAGQIAGVSKRITNVNTDNGADAWIYNPTTNTTVQIGLFGVGYTGSAGNQLSENNFQNAAGHVAGRSLRVTSLDVYQGFSTWVYTPVTNTTVQTGLTDAAHSGSTGFQSSTNTSQNAAGQVAGYSLRISGVNTVNGQNTWVYNPTTNVTVQTGLTSAPYTGNAGYQFSYNTLQTAAGQIAGYSYRISGINTEFGQSAWYFDPLTNLTSAIIGSVRTTDNYAFSTPTILTEGGFLLGNYLFFAGGLGSGEPRAFIFRPDLGLTDLGNLVAGGLTANGWSTLQSPIFSDALNTIVGYGYVDGQTTGRSVFVMNVPAPGSAMFMALGSLIAARRRR